MTALFKCSAQCFPRFESSRKNMSNRFAETEAHNEVSNGHDLALCWWLHHFKSAISRMRLRMMMPAGTLLLHCSMHPLSIAAPQIQCASLPNPERISVWYQSCHLNIAPCHSHVPQNLQREWHPSLSWSKNCEICKGLFCPHRLLKLLMGESCFYMLCKVSLMSHNRSQKAAEKGLAHLCEVASSAVDNLECMFQARFESLMMLNRRLKDDAGKKNTIIEGSYHISTRNIASRLFS